MSDLDRATDLVRNQSRFLIICHAEPDGDALGGALALAGGLRSLGKEVVVVCRDEPATAFQFLPEIETISTTLPQEAPDVLVIIDCGDLIRTGFPEQIRDLVHAHKPFINIDHHPKNDLHRLSTVNLVDQGVAASVQLVDQLLKALSIELTPVQATQLLTGLYTDTGGFKHSNTSPAVLEFAARLLSAGGRFKQIVRNISAARPLSALKLWGVALSRVRKHPQLPLVLSFVTKDDVERCRATVEDLGGVVNMINGIPGAQVAVLFAELSSGEIKVSIRTEADGVDVSRIATLFGGGGHKKASGFRLFGRLIPATNGWRLVTEQVGDIMIPRQLPVA